MNLLSLMKNDVTATTTTSRKSLHKSLNKQKSASSRVLYILVHLFAVPCKNNDVKYLIQSLTGEGEHTAVIFLFLP